MRFSVVTAEQESIMHLSTGLRQAQHLILSQQPITARAEVMDAAPAGTIGGTFCGNPVAAAAALAVMDVMKRDDYAAKARHIGETVMKRYKELQDKYDVIGDVRGLGAMVGIEFVKDRPYPECYPEGTSS